MNTKQVINSDQIIKENTLKNKERQKPYNPVTGIGCQGQRVHLNIKDAPVTHLLIPDTMKTEQAVQLLIKHGSIKKIFQTNKEKPSDQDIKDFWIFFCELRCKYDFEYFAFVYLVIHDKISSKDIPFLLNTGQRRLLQALENMRLQQEPIRIILLKARQWGGSTLIQLYMLWIQLIHKQNWNSVICAHIKDASLTIRAMFDRAIKKMPPIKGIKHDFKRYEGTSNIKQVPARGCLISVGTAEEPDSVRSQDAKMAHFSEEAYYPNTEANKTEDLETSIIGSIPSEPYTLIARESTANGVGNFFHEQWEKAKKGETSYTPIFVEWFLIDIYRKEFAGYYYQPNGKRKKGTIHDFIKSLNDYEINLFNNHKDCTLENINWRRLKRAEMSSEAKMKQEYPSDDIEAFQDSGMPAFRSEDVEAMRKNCKLPVAIGTLTSDMPPAMAKKYPDKKNSILSNIQFMDDKEALQDYDNPDNSVRERKERNKLKIWEFPVTDINVSDRYLVVFDPQKGISETADWGVILVIDRYWMHFGGKPEVVAEWRGRIDKDIAIWVAAQTATYYNNALLVVESNTYDSDIKEDDSEFIFDTIANSYTNLYSRTPADKIKQGIPAKYGFNTNRSTKPMLINNYVAILREGSYIERDNQTLNEARVYEQKKNGSFGAKDGKHDDKLITRMIGLHICYNEMPLPQIIEQETTTKFKRLPVESSI